MSERNTAPAFMLKLSPLFRGDRKKTGPNLMLLPVKKFQKVGWNGDDQSGATNYLKCVVIFISVLQYSQ